MDNRIEQIVQGFERVLKQSEGSFLATVKAVDGETLTCKDMNDTEYLNVRLSGTEGERGFVLVPKVGSWVIVSRLSNSDSLYVSMVSAVDGVMIMEGENGGLVKVEGLVSRMNTIEESINDLKQKLRSWTTAPNDGGASLKLILTDWFMLLLTKTKRADFENDKVKH